MSIPSDNCDEVTLRPVPKSRIGRTLWLVFAGFDAENRASQVAATVTGVSRNEVAVDGLWEAVRNERQVGAIWWYELPGKQAIIWPPQLIEGEPLTTADQLLHGALLELQQRGTRFFQSVLPLGDNNGAQHLERAGFIQAAHIKFLVWLAPEKTSGKELIETQEDEGPLIFESFRAEQSETLLKLVNATYEQTLDCPALNGVRETEEVLAGYRASGEFDPQRWLFVREAGTKANHYAGCLLLADHPTHDQWELVYMGLVPQARGKGWGGEIVRHAQRLVAKAGRSRIVLSVDANNHPAQQMYATTGFQEYQERLVFIRST